MSETQWPDVVAVTMDWVEAEFPALAGRVNDRTPAGLKTQLALGPFVRVGLVSGRDDSVTDRSVVDLEVFADSRAEGYDLSEDIRARFSGRSHRVGTVVIDRVRTEEKPRPLPWEDETVWRFGATYLISARR